MFKNGFLIASTQRLSTGWMTHKENIKAYSSMFTFFLQGNYKQDDIFFPWSRPKVSRRKGK